jgi:hypothetical protein
MKLKVASHMMMIKMMLTLPIFKCLFDTILFYFLTWMCFYSVGRRGGKGKFLSHFLIKHGLFQPTFISFLCRRGLSLSLFLSTSLSPASRYFLRNFLCSSSPSVVLSMTEILYLSRSIISSQSIRLDFDAAFQLTLS